MFELLFDIRFFTFSVEMAALAIIFMCIVILLYILALSDCCIKTWIKGFYVSSWIGGTFFIMTVILLPILTGVPIKYILIWCTDLAMLMLALSFSFLSMIVFLPVLTLLIESYSKRR